MSDLSVRGYAIVFAGEYLRKEGGEEAIGALPPEVRHTLQTAAPASWQPAAQMSEVFRAIAKLGKGDEAKAREHLEKCGEYQAAASTSTFLKLVLKVLTPGMFAKKLPSLWSRDSNVGVVSVELFDDRLVLHLRDSQALEHLIPTMIGYVRYTLKAMGVDVIKSSLHGWSLATPTGPHLWFESHWKPQ